MQPSKSQQPVIELQVRVAEAQGLRLHEGGEVRLVLTLRASDDLFGGSFGAKVTPWLAVPAGEAPHWTPREATFAVDADRCFEAEFVETARLHIELMQRGGTPKGPAGLGDHHHHQSSSQHPQQPLSQQSSERPVSSTAPTGFGPPLGGLSFAGTSASSSSSTAANPWAAFKAPSMGGLSFSAALQQGASSAMSAASTAANSAWALSQVAPNNSTLGEVVGTISIPVGKRLVCVGTSDAGGGTWVSLLDPGSAQAAKSHGKVKGSLLLELSTRHRMPEQGVPRGVPVQGIPVPAGQQHQLQNQTQPQVGQVLAPAANASDVVLQESSFVPPIHLGSHVQRGDGSSSARSDTSGSTTAASMPNLSEGKDGYRKTTEEDGGRDVVDSPSARNGNDHSNTTNDAQNEVALDEEHRHQDLPQSQSEPQAERPASARAIATTKAAAAAAATPITAAAAAAAVSAPTTSTSTTASKDRAQGQSQLESTGGAAARSASEEPKVSADSLAQMLVQADSSLKHLRPRAKEWLPATAEQPQRRNGYHESSRERVNIFTINNPECQSAPSSSSSSSAWQPSRWSPWGSQGANNSNNNHHHDDDDDEDEDEGRGPNRGGGGGSSSSSSRVGGASRPGLQAAALDQNYAAEASSAGSFGSLLGKWTSTRPTAPRIRPLKEKLRSQLDPSFRSSRREVQKWRGRHEVFVILNEMQHSLSEATSLLAQGSGSMRRFGDSHGVLSNFQMLSAFLCDAALYYKSEASVPTRLEEMLMDLERIADNFRSVPLTPSLPDGVVDGSDSFAQQGARQQCLDLQVDIAVLLESALMAAQQALAEYKKMHCRLELLATEYQPLCQMELDTSARLAFLPLLADDTTVEASSLPAQVVQWAEDFARLVVHSSKHLEGLVRELERRRRRLCDCAGEMRDALLRQAAGDGEEPSEAA